jgi:hypothetical protein
MRGTGFHAARTNGAMLTTKHLHGHVLAVPDTA